MDVLAELSYVSMTPDHFPSMFCKVGKARYSKADGLFFLNDCFISLSLHPAKRRKLTMFMCMCVYRR